MQKLDTRGRSVYLQIISLIVLIAYQLILDFSFFPVLSTTDITEAYEVGNSRYAYTFFTVVAF